MMATVVDRIRRYALLVTALLFSAGYALVGLLILLATAVWEGVVTRRVPWERSLMDWPFLAFGGAFLISALASAYPATSFGALITAVLTIYLGYGIGFRTLRHEPTLRDRLIGAWFAGGVITAMWATLVGNMRDGPAALPAMAENLLGSALLVAFLFGMQFIGRARSGWWLMAVGAGMAVIPAALVLTDARGAWVGLAAGLIVFSVLVPAANRRRMLLPVAVVGFAAVLLMPRSVDAIDRIRSIVGVETRRDRLALADSAIAVFRDHPLVGTGLNTFIHVHPRYPSRYQPDLAPRSSAHNIFLNMAAEGGLLGLGTFAWIVVAALAAGWRLHTGGTSPLERLVSASVVAGFVGMVVQQQFDATIMSAQVAAGFWLLIAVVAASVRTDTHEARAGRPSLLIVSNGHGEDAVGALLAQSLLPHADPVAYPLVGAGSAYANVQLLSPRRSLPSGGFGLRGSSRSFLSDVRAGVHSHWLAQWRTLRSRRGAHDIVVAVGDVYCLCMAAAAGRRPVFIATAKSERNEPHRWVERVLIRRLASRVFARDAVTADALRRAKIQARYAGNVLMDTIGSAAHVPGGAIPTVVLLPGSRTGAIENMTLLLQLAEHVGKQLGAQFVCPLVPSLERAQVAAAAAEAGWAMSGDELRHNAVGVRLTDGFGDAIFAATVVVGLAGTANEQAAGLGKPVVAFPGRGPQFSPRFMALQQRLLGDALVAAQDWREAADVVVRLLRDPGERARRGEVGRQRMGEPGAVKRIADEILKMLRAV